MNERRGVATAGTWCVDFNKTIAEWPAEDTTNEILAMDRQGGGSGCNMAIDLKRLDPALPVETMGVVGDDDDARFLLAQCDAFGVEREGLVSLPGGVDDDRRRLQRALHRPAHAFLSPGRRGADEPRAFRFFAFARALPASRPARRPCSHGRALARRRQRLGRDIARGASVRSRHQSRADIDCRAKRSPRWRGRACRISTCSIVNDYEIGAVADIETRDARGANPNAIARARRGGAVARRDAPRRRAFSRRRDRGDARRGALRAGLGRDAERRRSPASTARATPSPPACSTAWHEGWRDRSGPAARPCLRGRVDARGFDDHGRRAGRRVPRARGKMGPAADAGLTRGAARVETRRADVSQAEARIVVAAFPYRILFIRHGETAITRKGGCRASATFRSTARGANRRARSGAR